MKKNKEKKPSIGYVAIEVIIIMTIVIIGGIFAISSFFIKGQDNYTEVEKAEDQVYDAVIFNPHNPGGGEGSGNPGGPGGTGGGGSETINYTIVFDGNGGSNSSKKVQKGNKLGSLPSSTYEGYTFIGWFTAKTGGDKITDNYLPDGDKTFYAHWASNDYEVVYHGNGNTGGETKKSSHTYGTEFKLTKNGFVKTGYSFLGWNTKQDGKGKTYSDEQKVKNLTAEKGGIFNLYAQWKINSYSVSFKGNGGTDSATIIRKYNEALGTLPSSNRTGYTFKGWYTSADGGEQVTAATKVPAHDKSETMKVGEDIYAVGNPLGSLGGTVTEGILSAKDREIAIDGQMMTLFQISAAINPGNSGGGLFNNKGELVGIVNAKSSGTAIEGLGFAIPIDIAKDVVEDLVKNGEVTGRLTLGIKYYEISDISTAMQFNVNTVGLLVDEVTKGSNADKAGIKKGDIIVETDDKQVTTGAELTSALRKHKAGETMSFMVVRNREFIDLTCILEEGK